MAPTAQPEPKSGLEGILAAGAQSRWRSWLGEAGLQRALLYLPLAFLILFLAIPLGLTLVWSVFERTTFWMEPGFTLEAYENLFFSPRLESLLRSMLHAFAAVIVSFVLGFPIAVFVRRRVPPRARHAVILLFILPFMISELIRTFALRPVLGRTGLINGILMNLGIVDEPISAILYTPLGMIIGEVLSFLPFMVFSGFLAMEAVESYVFEVSDDLGASTWQTFKDIVVPLGAPGIFAGSLFIFTNGIGLAIIPDFLGGPGAVNGGILVLNAIQAIDFPLAMAISAVMMATMILLILAGHWLFDLRRILAPVRR